MYFDDMSEFIIFQRGHFRRGIFSTLLISYCYHILPRLTTKRVNKFKDYIMREIIFFFYISIKLNYTFSILDFMILRVRF